MVTLDVLPVVAEVTINCAVPAAHATVATGVVLLLSAVATSAIEATLERSTPLMAFGVPSMVRLIAPSVMPVNFASSCSSEERTPPVSLPAVAGVFKAVLFQ
jgi:hypothetical protein